jgi:hypothetical protein
MEEGKKVNNEIVLRKITIRTIEEELGDTREEGEQKETKNIDNRVQNTRKIVVIRVK